MSFFTFFVACASLALVSSNSVPMEATARDLLQNLVNHFSQAATASEMTMVTTTSKEEVVSEITTQVDSKTSNLRTVASGGFLQYVLYADSACTSMMGVVDVALDVCVPFSNVDLGSNYVIISASGTTLQINGYSDSSCSTAAGSISVDVSAGATCGATTNSQFFVFSSTSLPNPPFVAGTSYLSANIYQTDCSSPVVISVQAPEPPSQNCVIVKPGCISIPVGAIPRVNVAVYGYGTCAIVPASNSVVTDTSQSANSPSDSPSTCFAGSEVVLLSSGETRAISDVKLGDEIAIASMDGTPAGFSSVIAIPHSRNSIKAKFSHITTVSGRDVKMTPEHLVLGGACDVTLSLVQAGSLKAGQCMQTVSGAEVVKSIATVVSEGIYTVVTKHDGLLIVNGVVASPFAVNHLVANSFYGIVRALYSLFPSVAKSSLARHSLESFGELVVNNMS